MSAEDKEDLSMEDILSSIRDILMEDNVSQEEHHKSEEYKPTSPEVVEEVTVINPVEEIAPDFAEEKVEEIINTIEDIEPEDNFLDDIELPNFDDDEVFNLSEEMIVEDTDDITKEIIDLEVAPLQPVEVNVEEELKVSDIEGILSEPEVEAGDKVDEEIALLASDEDEPLDLDADIVDINFDNLVDEDVIPYEEEAKVEKTPAEAYSGTEETLTPVVEEAKEELDAVKEIFTEETIEEVVEEVEPVSIVEAIPQVEAVAKVVEEKIKTDVSENLLNDFAKIFEEDRQEKIISDVAREEIAKQTKTWLDENLSSVVLEVVKKEVTRVMAKVGK